eukprot:Rhum_TRINITY_DN14501_c0_g2::Rhum_TRINITY_DN14501_c0_g2_i1::g.93525::m.93525
MPGVLGSRALIVVIWALFVFVTDLASGNSLDQIALDDRLDSDGYLILLTDYAKARLGTRLDESTVFALNSDVPEIVEFTYNRLSGDTTIIDSHAVPFAFTAGCIDATNSAAFHGFYNEGGVYKYQHVVPGQTMIDGQVLEGLTDCTECVQNPATGDVYVSCGSALVALRNGVPMITRYSSSTFSCLAVDDTGTHLVVCSGDRASDTSVLSLYETNASTTPITFLRSRSAGMRFLEAVVYSPTYDSWITTAGRTVEILKVTDLNPVGSVSLEYTTTGLAVNDEQDWVFVTHLSGTDALVLSNAALSSDAGKLSFEKQPLRDPVVYSTFGYFAMSNGKGRVQYYNLTVPDPCNPHVCPDTHLKKPRVVPTCALMTCTDDECCDPLVYCSSFTCGTEHRADADMIACGISLADCNSTQCCLPPMCEDCSACFVAAQIPPCLASVANEMDCVALHAGTWCTTQSPPTETPMTPAPDTPATATISLPVVVDTPQPMATLSPMNIVATSQPTQPPDTPAPPTATPVPVLGTLPPTPVPTPTVSPTTPTPLGSGDSPAPVAQTTAPTTPLPTPIPTARVVTPSEGTEKTGGIAAAGSLLSGTTAGPTLRSVVAAQGCYRHEVQSSQLPLALHPTRWSPYGSAALGMVLGNFAIVCGITVLSCGLVLALEQAAPRLPQFQDQIDSQGMLRFPSVPYFTLQFMYQGIVMGGMMLIMQPFSAGAFVAGMAAVLLCLALPFYAFVTIKNNVPAKATYMAEVGCGNLRDLLLGPGEWVSTSRGEDYVNRYASLIRFYKEETAWYQIIEYCGSFSLAAIQSVIVANDVSCGHVKVGAGIVFAMLLGLQVHLQPLAKIRDQVCDIAVLMVQCLAMFLMAYGYYAVQSDTWMFDAASALLTSSLAVLVAKTCVDTCCEVYVFVSGRRRHLRSRRESMQSALSAHLPSPDSDLHCSSSTTVFSDSGIQKGIYSDDASLSLLRANQFSL